MHQHRPECHAKRLVCYLQGLIGLKTPTIFKVKVTMRAVIKYGFYHFIWNSLLFLRPNFIGWYIIMFGSILCKNWIFEFKVKGHSEGSNIHWIFVLIFCTTGLLATKLGVSMHCYWCTEPSTTKWAYTESKFVTYSITRHLTGGYFAVLSDKLCSPLPILSPVFPASSLAHAVSHLYLLVVKFDGYFPWWVPLEYHSCQPLAMKKKNSSGGSLLILK